ncbi:bet v i allergen [Fusarium albosuccineum]|uniref:Bet v i allergen n=1 Tax=Fusarium albosuccineum TaxID=1237068 RepID=A0A8H4L166_9HYPO|nr:bet v i allergen [Fusarium albosuccineum]
MAGIIASKLALGQVTKTFNSPIARTWALWSSFGAAHLYIAGCDAVELQGFGIGSVRLLSMYGNKVQETLKYIDPATHSYAYTIADSPGFPATGALGFIQLQELGKSETQITWKGFVDRVTPGAEDALKQQITTIYIDSIEKARRTLEK